MTVFIAVQNGTGGNHFRVQQGVTGNLPHEVPVMPVGPVQHGRHAKHRTPVVGNRLHEAQI